MLLSLKIDHQIVKTDYKLRKQMKEKINLQQWLQNHNCKEVLLVNTEGNLKNDLSHLENRMLMQSKTLNIIPESESEK